MHILGIVCTAPVSSALPGTLGHSFHPIPPPPSHAVEGEGLGGTGMHSGQSENHWNVPSSDLDSRDRSCVGGKVTVAGTVWTPGTAGGGERRSSVQRCGNLPPAGRATPPTVQDLGSYKQWSQAPAPPQCRSGPPWPGIALWQEERGYTGLPEVCCHVPTETWQDTLLT